MPSGVPLDNTEYQRVWARIGHVLGTSGGNMATKGTKRGIGSIRKLPSGKYQLRYTDPNGLRKAGGVTYSSKTQAEHALLDIRRTIENGTYEARQAVKAGDVDPRTLTLEGLGAYWRGIRLNRRGQSLRPSTLNEYERLMQNVLGPLKDKPVRTITTGQIEKWWAPEHKKAPNQASKAYKHLNTLMKYAQKRNWVTRNPCDIEGAGSYTPPKQPDVPTAEQVSIMLDVSPEPFRTMVALAVSAGIRKGELLALTRADVETLQADGDTRIFVNVDKALTWDGTQEIVGLTKSEGSVRAIELPEWANQYVTKHLTTLPINPDALLFPRKAGSSLHWGKYQMNPVWRAVRAQSGFQGRFHSLRAFHLTQYGLTGATAAELMARGGHRDLATAQRYQRTTGRETQLLKKIGQL
jgi:integrase